MGSQAGRKVQSWVSTPQGCFLKGLLHALGNRGWMDMGLRGSAYNEYVYRHYARLVPYHQDYWERPRTKKSIVGRAMTTTRSHHASRENAFENDYTAPYMGLVFNLLERDKPWERAELDARIARIAAIAARAA